MFLRDDLKKGSKIQFSDVIAAGSLKPAYGFPCFFLAFLRMNLGCWKRVWFILTVAISYHLLVPFNVHINTKLFSLYVFMGKVLAMKSTFYKFLSHTKAAVQITSNGRPTKIDVFFYC